MIDKCGQDALRGFGSTRACESWPLNRVTSHRRANVPLRAATPLGSTDGIGRRYSIRFERARSRSSAPPGPPKRQRSSTRDRERAARPYAVEGSSTWLSRALLTLRLGQQRAARIADRLASAFGQNSRRFDQPFAGAWFGRLSTTPTENWNAPACVGRSGRVCFTALHARVSSTASTVYKRRPAAPHLRRKPFAVGIDRVSASHSFRSSGLKRT